MSFPTLNQIVWFSNMPDHMAGCGIVVRCDNNSTCVQVPSMVSDQADMVIFEGLSCNSVCENYTQEDWSFDALHPNK